MRRDDDVTRVSSGCHHGAGLDRRAAAGGSELNVNAGALWLVLLAADGGAPAHPDAAAPASAAPAPAPVRKLGLVAKQWQSQRAPAGGPALSIGTCSCGCLQGAATLPVGGPGYEVLHLGRNRRFGHPLLIAYVQRLAAAAKAAKVGPLVIGDLSQPRGGPTPSGHRSHQTGLDADIGYVAPAGLRAGHVSARARERLGPPAVVDTKTHEPTRAWTPKIPELLALAASDPAVDRIFVAPGIKKMLCAAPATAKAPWQGRLRPWWGHHDHFHVRLKCPPDSPLCVRQDPPPDDGCGATLAWWFSADAEATRTKKKDAEVVEAEPTLPPACGDLMQ
jgi:penicillin-insensitive murein endopeptidase